MNKLIITLCFATCVMGAWAQSAKDILDATAAHMTARGGVRAQFKATQFQGTTPESETTGTLLINGQQFQMETLEMTTWFDGKTQWAMLKGAGEVNVSEPTEEERAAMNPSTLIGIYKKGYSYKLKKSTLRGKPTYQVYLKAKNKKAAFSEIYVDVEQATCTPLCLRAKRDGNWMRLAILSFQNGQTLPASTFTFPTKDYPDIEVIDLR